MGVNIIRVKNSSELDPGEALKLMIQPWQLKTFYKQSYLITRVFILLPCGYQIPFNMILNFQIQGREDLHVKSDDAISQHCPSHSNQDTHISSRFSVSSHGAETPHATPNAQYQRKFDDDGSNKFGNNTQTNVNGIAQVILGQSQPKVRDSNEEKLNQKNHTQALPIELSATHVMLQSLLGKRMSEDNQQYSAIEPTTRVSLPMNSVSDGTDRGLNLSAQAIRN